MIKLPFVSRKKADKEIIPCKWETLHDVEDTRNMEVYKLLEEYKNMSKGYEHSVGYIYKKFFRALEINKSLYAKRVK